MTADFSSALPCCMLPLYQGTSNLRVQKKHLRPLLSIQVLGSHHSGSVLGLSKSLCLSIFIIFSTNNPHVADVGILEEYILRNIQL